MKAKYVLNEIKKSSDILKTIGVGAELYKKQEFISSMMELDGIKMHMGTYDAKLRYHEVDSYHLLEARSNFGIDYRGHIRLYKDNALIYTNSPNGKSCFNDTIDDFTKKYSFSYTHYDYLSTLGVKQFSKHLAICLYQLQLA